MASPVYASAFAAVNMLSAIVGVLLAFSAGFYIYTWIKFQLGFRKFNSIGGGTSLTAPHLPVAIPWIGNAPAFLSQKPGKFFADLFTWYPRKAGACEITLGGNRTVVIFDKHATQYIVRDRKLNRNQFNEQIACNGLGLSKTESDKFYEYHLHEGEGNLPGYVEQEKINVEYMLKTERVNEMTAEFIQSLQEQVSQQFMHGSAETFLFSWLRGLMFVASTKALMGQRILDVIPNLEELFFQFDQDMLSMFFGLPNFMLRKQIANRDQAVASLIKWHETVKDESGGKVVDPDSVPWEPLYGSRLNRARQDYYKRKEISLRSAAGLDLGMLFGISSNAIPAAGWMLLHILDSTRTGDNSAPTLYAYIMSEVKEAQRPDGSLDVPTLVNQPILVSCLHEVLRIYVDTLVTRQVPSDFTLPLSPNSQNKPSNASRSLFCKAGSLLMIPSYPAHTNPDTWQSPDQPAPTVFYPYRFLTGPPKGSSTDKPVFTTAPYTGMFFPFGGGKTICPGRVFAKQEILGAVASVLLTFDFEVLGYVDANGKETSKFPGLRDSLPGSAVMVASGDLKVKVQRKRSG